MKYNNLRRVQYSHTCTNSHKFERFVCGCVRICEHCTRHNTMINNGLTALLWICADLRVLQ